MAKNLKVVHSQVGAWPKDHVLSAKELPSGTDVARLLALKAVEETDEPQTGNAPINPDSIYQAKLAETTGPDLVPAKTPKVS